MLTLGVGLTSALLVGIAGATSYAENTVDRQFPTEVVVEGAELPVVAARLAANPSLTVTTEPARVLVDPAGGLSAALRGAVDAAIADAPVSVQYAGDLRREVESSFATARAVGFGLVGMTLLVAVVGVGVTLMLSVTERTRETGLLRAVGLTAAGSGGWSRRRRRSAARAARVTPTQALASP